MGGQEAVVVRWEEGETLVRWARGSGDLVEKRFGVVPRAVVAWGGHVLVVEAMPPDGAPKDNAVVFGADGAERVRLRPPPTAGGPHDVIGFHTAYLDASGPLVVVATRVGDLWGRVDLRAGILVDVRTWR